MKKVITVNEDETIDLQIGNWVFKNCTLLDREEDSFSLTYDSDPTKPIMVCAPISLECKCAAFETDTICPEPTPEPETPPTSEG